MAPVMTRGFCPFGTAVDAEMRGRGRGTKQKARLATGLGMVANGEIFGRPVYNGFEIVLNGPA